MKSAIEACGLKMENLSGFVADNTNTNFGRHHSVYVLLRNVNPNVFKCNCKAHIVHNTLRKYVLSLGPDIENIILKLYSHFSCSSTRREKIKNIYEMMSDCDFLDFLRHVLTRWLSIKPAAERVLKNWVALREYFSDLIKQKDGISDLNSDKILNLLFKKEGNQYVFQDHLKVYFQFISHVLAAFEPAFKSLQKTKGNISEVFSIMNTLKMTLTEYKEKKDYGRRVRADIISMPDEKKQSIYKELRGCHSIFGKKL